MGTTVSVMGQELDMLDQKALLSKVQEYLKSEGFHVIILANTIILDALNETEEIETSREAADLILPGEETVLSLHHVETLKVGAMVVDYTGIGSVFERIKEEKVIYLIAENNEKASQYMEFFESHYKNWKVEGCFTEDIMANEELAVNEINGIAPDLLLVMLESPLEEQWIFKNKTKLNCKLCIALGSYADKLFGEDNEVPSWVRWTHISKLFLCIRNNFKLKKIRENRIFKKKVEQYKNKKGDAKNGEVDK